MTMMMTTTTTKIRRQRQRLQQQKYNEIMVTLRIPRKYYKTACTLSHLQGFKSFEEYISHAVIQDIEAEADRRYLRKLLEEE